jgi:hypothetical protein
MTIRQRGSDWSHLRVYWDTDDIRDIAWNKVRPDGLSTRVRETHGDYHIISYLRTTPYDDFSIWPQSDSRYHMIQELRKNIETSAKFAGYQYSEYTRLDQLTQVQPKNTIMFISGTDITPDMRLLAYHNDLIYLDIIHPWELDPTSDILFSWQILDTKKYLQEYKKIQDLKRDTIKKIKASYISLSTADDIVDVLNTFFKKRYTHD